MQSLNDLLKTIFSGFKNSLKSINLNIENTKANLEKTKANLEKTKANLENIKTATDLKMDKNNPTGTGSFSLNRKPGSTIGINSHAEGSYNTASGDYSHAEGSITTASGRRSHAEGYNTKASGDYSHAEGSDTTASGMYSHAEGYSNTASGEKSHVEGHDTKASGRISHAEGSYTTASGVGSHAEGHLTIASGYSSHTEGEDTKASSSNQHVQGKFNIEDSSNVYADIIGNGTEELKRSNAATVDWSGNAWYAGDVYVGSTSGTNKDEGSKKLATEEYVNAAQPLFIDFYHDSSQDKIVTDSTITLEEMKAIIQKRTVYCKYKGYVLTLSEIRDTYISFFYYWVKRPNNPSDSFSWGDFSISNSGWACEFNEL